MIAITPKIASAISPSERMRTKKTPMIALKRVKTLPATMLETERDEVSGGAPSLRRRLAASALLRPLSAASGGSVAVAALEPIKTPRARLAAADTARYSVLGFAFGTTKGC